MTQCHPKTVLFRDSKDNVWVGTNNNGLIVLDKEYNVIKIFTKENIGSNGIKGIVEDNNGHIWSGKNVSEASYAVGISDPNYFTKCFKKEFGTTPTEFLKQCIKNETDTLES